MIDFEKIKKALADSNKFTKYTGATILNGSLMYMGADSETFAISITEDEKGTIVLSDFGTTVARLEKQDFMLDDEDVAFYVRKVLNTFLVDLGPSNELIAKAKNEADVPFALSRLYQTVILLSYIDLQFDYEEDEE